MVASKRKSAPQKRSRNTNVPKKQRNTASFGPVSTIDTAPVAIGNSLRGAQTAVINLADGARIIGRDFCFAAQGTVAAATNWSLIGGMPLTPACLPSSILRNYVQMYNKFKINAVNVHYITSSATIQTGDIMFYYEKDRMSPCIDFTNSSFLPFVLSDPHTVIGPQWTNHTLSIRPKDGFNSTNYGLNTDLNEDTCGSVFLFSKTSSANSPGYIVIDYDITFQELSVNPRAGILPVSRAQWNYLTLGMTAQAVTGASVFYTAILGVNPDGSSSLAPTGTAVGDIFKGIACVTNSTVSGTNATWTNVTAANLLTLNQGLSGSGAVTTAIPLDDGFTCYLVYTNQGVVAYSTLDNAITNTNPLLMGVSATVTFRLCFMISLVFSNSSFLQSAY
jgi:hypothetical protein